MASEKNNKENIGKDKRVMGKFENLIDMKKVNELLEKKDQELAKLYKLIGKKEVVQEQEEDKKFNALVWVLAIIGVVAAVAGICYLVYRYFTPNYLDDFDDDFDEEFEDDFEDFENDDFDADDFDTEGFDSEEPADAEDGDSNKSGQDE